MEKKAAQPLSDLVKKKINFHGVEPLRSGDCLLLQHSLKGPLDKHLEGQGHFEMGIIIILMEILMEMQILEVVHLDSYPKSTPYYLCNLG